MLWLCSRVPGVIHLIPKDTLLSLSQLLIGPCCLDPVCRIQTNIWLKTRQQGPINMETKEKCIFHHFGIRCITSSVSEKPNRPNRKFFYT